MRLRKKLSNIGHRAIRLQPPKLDSNAGRRKVVSTGREDSSDENFGLGCLIFVPYAV
jgi:hypothetical protein